MVDNASFKKVTKYYFDAAKPLAKGTYGTVYQASDETDPTAKYAIKMIPMRAFLESPGLKDRMIKEINLLRQIKAENIVQLVDILETPNNLYLVMEYCDGRDLQDKFYNGQTWTEDEACSIVKQIASAFVSIEKLDIFGSDGKKMTVMHRDIKPTNILFSNGKVKIADFGFARTVAEVDKNIEDSFTTLDGCPLYAAPQLLKSDKYSTKCDIWSAGVVFYRLVFGGIPWEARSKKDLCDSIKSKPLRFTKEVRQETKDLISKMLQHEESARPTWKEVYEDPALKNF